MPVLIQEAPAAIFTCTFVKMPHVFTSPATADQTLIAFKSNLAQEHAISLF